MTEGFPVSLQRDFLFLLILVGMLEFNTEIFENCL